MKFLAKSPQIKSAENSLGWLRLPSVSRRWFFVVDLLFNVPPNVCGELVLVFVLVCINLCLYSFAIILTRKRELVALL